MMRLFCALLMTASAGLPAQAWSQTATQGADAAIEACLHANVERVVAQTDSLVDASEFLLDSVCAVEVASAYRRMQQRSFERMREQFCENGRPRASALQSDPGDETDTAAYLNAYCNASGAWSAESISDSVMIVDAMATPADRALAAQLILQAHERNR